MSFIQTLSGKHFNYNDIQEDAIVIEDIATALSHICRFAGHSTASGSIAFWLATWCRRSSHSRLYCMTLQRLICKTSLRRLSDYCPTTRL